MHDRQTGNWIVLNGEIYNHLEIRKELRGTCDQWKSQSDTETLLRAYATWGMECLSRIRGMFAFALYDAARERLLCARDRFGIKPLYIAETLQGIGFASEVRALLRAGIVSSDIDPAGLASYVRYGSVSEPHTMFANIKTVPAATWIEIASARIAKQVTYWDIASEPRDPDDGAPTHVRVREHLQRSVREHLLSDVPVASFLSGGVDSSIITALAAQESNRPLRTFTVGFPGENRDERKFARAVAQRYGTEHHEVVVTENEAAALVPDGVHAMDQPSADALNTFVVSHAVSATGTKVVMSGLAGDELFGGYRSFRLLPFADRWANVAGWISPDSAVASVIPGRARAIEVFRRGASLEIRYAALRSYWSCGEMQAMQLTPAPLEESPSPEALSIRSRVSLLEMQHYMRNVLLRDCDAMSMAHSLEVRVPFLDHRLAAFAVQRGVMGNGWKPTLIAATRDLLPASSFNRRKQGFVLPMKTWMRGTLSEYVRDGLDSLSSSKVLPGVRVDELCTRFELGGLPWSRLWQFVVLGHWLRDVTGSIPADNEPATAVGTFGARSSATA
jgi:asparagine synthase (glutamine-hydrolysing)